MKDVDRLLIRLLRSAARADGDETSQMPFGFDSRVLAYLRDDGATNGNGLGRLIRRVVIAACAIIVGCSAAVAHEFVQAREFDEPMANEFAIADSAIDSQLQR